MSATPRSIRTPDQRLRVFVSSTLKELAPERRSARSAVERLHLAPVMFELGARPHPPRDLYRAYLDQSDVFLGLYWQRYGWVAPGEEVSGLEDEYNLAPGLPKLIYIKEPVEPREPRLEELLSRIRTDDTASFKYFTTAKELGALVLADLATLLAERFDLSRTAAAPASLLPTETTDAGPFPVAPPLTTASTERPGSAVGDAPLSASPFPALPSPLTSLIGREDEVQAVERMLRRPSTRFVTLLGPGGIGKSRIAIEVASRMADDFPAGVFFVDLSPVHSPELVTTAIASVLGVRDTGDAPLWEKIITAVRNRRVLIALDNVEQVLSAAPQLTALLTAAPGVKLLLTSRTPVRVQAEQSYLVGPLPLPLADKRVSVEQLASVASVTLFLERVHAVKPDFEITEHNADAIARICAALDGVPLAIELAAARMRVLSPASMLERLDRRLPLLVGGLRDLPERQQTLRRTIQWSTELLGDPERELLATLAVFDGGFFLEAAEAVWNDRAAQGGGGLDDALSLLATLVDNSLVREQDRGESSHFSMLAMVREYALEQLAAGGTLETVRERHARYYVDLGRRIERELEGERQREWVARLADDRDNLRGAVRFLLERQEWSEAAEFAWTLYIYWWIGGHLGEVRGWMDDVLAANQTLPNRTRAIALYFTCAITFWQNPEDLVIPGLTESATLFHHAKDAAGEALALVSLALALLASGAPDPVAADEALESSLGLFRDSGDVWGESMALVTIGRLALLQNKLHGALNRFEESLALARRGGDDLGETIAQHHLGWARLLLGDLDDARTAFERCLERSHQLGHVEGVAYGLEGLVAVAASTGDVQRAGRLLGAAELLREVSGMQNAPAFSFHARLVDPILAGEGAAPFALARAEGRELSVDDAVSYALTERDVPGYAPGYAPGSMTP